MLQHARDPPVGGPGMEFLLTSQLPCGPPPPMFEFSNRDVGTINQLISASGTSGVELLIKDRVHQN